MSDDSATGSRKRREIRAGGICPIRSAFIDALLLKRRRDLAEQQQAAIPDERVRGTSDLPRSAPVDRMGHVFENFNLRLMRR